MLVELLKVFTGTAVFTLAAMVISLIFGLGWNVGTVAGSIFAVLFGIWLLGTLSGARE